MTAHNVNELIDRLAAELIEPDEWNDLESHAADRPAIWRDMAVAQYERDRFDRAMNEAANKADLIELPQIDELPDAQPAGRPATARLAIWNQWAGWALAAVLVLAFAVRFTSPGTSQPVGPNMQRADLRPGDALNQYLNIGRDSGSVIDEMPRKVLLQSRPVSDGSGYEVYFIRQILERTVVPDLYEYAGENEMGQPTLVRFEQPNRRGT